jgi:4-hydroxybenzoate polyprenyltransferase
MEIEISRSAKSSSFNFMDYILIARPEHWVKHVFIAPGIVLALILTGRPESQIWFNMIVGLVSACLLASANYVINGWLDGQYDKFHPSKKDRPAATGRVKASIIYLEYAALLAVGLGLAALVNKTFLVTGAIFVLMGVIYNVRPLRFKDYAFVDVLTESINNPLRLMLGWSMVLSTTFPPSSIFLAYWFGGAFLMGAKRLAEYRFIAGQDKIEDLKKYRRSFAKYTESSLIVSTFMYGLLSSFFMAAFLIKHRNEFLILFPAVAALFAYYLNMALDTTSVVQSPEKLWRDRGLMSIVIVIMGLFFLLSVTNLPLTEKIIGINQGINYRPW